MENKFFVGCSGDDLTIMAWMKKLSKEDAINLAAWLVALSGTSKEKFAAKVDEVNNT